MERINGAPLYWLGHSIGALATRLLNPGVMESATPASIMSEGIQARANLQYFVNLPAGLPLSKEAAKAILANLDKVLAANQGLLNILPEEEKRPLIGSLFHFQSVLSAELAQLNIYYITPKRAYEMTTLINQGEKVLSLDTINVLVASKDDVIKEIREATKCLAFDISTAVGFHVYRAIEAIIIKDYFRILDIKPEEWEKNKNLGNYIMLLENKKVDVRITGVLRHLKDNYRNPISHPQEFWDSNKAESSFGLAISAITVMVQGIQERTQDRALPLASMAAAPVKS